MGSDAHQGWWQEEVQPQQQVHTQHVQWWQEREMPVQQQVEQQQVHQQQADQMQQQEEEQAEEVQKRDYPDMWSCWRCRNIYLGKPWVCDYCERRDRQVLVQERSWPAWEEVAPQEPQIVAGGAQHLKPSSGQYAAGVSKGGGMLVWPVKRAQQEQGKEGVRDDLVAR